MSQTESKGWKQKISERIFRPERVYNAFSRMTQEAGFIPLFNVDDLEIRRQDVKAILEKVKPNIFNPHKNAEMQRTVIQESFNLFFTVGSMWIRGLDNRELSEKVAFFIDNCIEVGTLPEFHPDLFEEALQLLHLSFQAQDVTNTPPYIIESRPIIDAGSRRAEPEYKKNEEFGKDREQ